MNINKLLIEDLENKNLKISTVESVTGGKIASYLIEVPGASKVIEQSYIVYSNKAKEEFLKVDKRTIDKYGVVSFEVALEMARKAKSISGSDVIIATTGEAGPSQNDTSIEVGTVCFGIIIKSKEFAYKKIFKGDRSKIINQAVIDSLKYLLNKLN